MEAPREGSCTLSVGGMSCAACVNTIESYLKAQDGVKEAVVNLVTQQAHVKYDPDIIGKFKFIDLNSESFCRDS